MRIGTSYAWCTTGNMVEAATYSRDDMEVKVSKIALTRLGVL
ncbi:MAG: hypothetical protein ABFC94_14740 [Syntrophomonas sp.]